MPSGESFIRQFLFGQRYFETKFGKRCETSWMPDSFGMSGALPQLMRGAGVWQSSIFSATSHLLLRNEVYLCTKNFIVRC